MTTSARVIDPELGESGKNPLKGLLDFGQSPWMDYIRRDLLTSGELKKLIRRRRPSRHDLQSLHFRESHFRAARITPTFSNRLTPRNSTPRSVYEKIAIRDVQDATDIFQPGLRREQAIATATSASKFRPLLALEHDKTIDEARRLWKAVNRPNVMIKVPGTQRRRPRHPPASRRRHQHQYHAALRAVRVRAGGRSLHRGARSARPQGQDIATSPASPASSSAASTPWSTARSTKS